MLYNLYEMNHAALVPWRAAADMGLNFWQNPVNPWSSSSTARAVTASLELFERATRRFAKPSFELKETTVGGVTTLGMAPTPRRARDATLVTGRRG